MNQLRLENFFPYRSVSLAERISNALSKIYVSRYGIAVGEWRVMATLGEFEQMQARDIGCHAKMDKVRVSRAVKQLREKGLLQTEVLEDDHRGSMLRLSDEGKALYQKIVPEALAWERELLAPLSPEDRKSLDRIFAQLDQRLVDLLEE